MKEAVTLGTKAGKSYSDHDLYKEMQKGNKDTMFIAVMDRPLYRPNDEKMLNLIDDAKSKGFGVIPVKNRKIGRAWVIHVPGAKNKAKQLADFAATKNGFVRDDSPEDARLIGRLLDYSEEDIEAYVDKRYGKMKNENKLRKIIKIIVERKLREATTNYQVYHSSYSSAVQEAIRYIESRGYNVSDDEIWNNISTGPKKPYPGNTNRIGLEITPSERRREKTTRKMAHIQVYNRGVDGNTYELNVYIN